MRRIWALGDTHLSFAAPKPMDKFGSLWTDHPAKIAKNCRALIDPADILLIPGDLSWALKRSGAAPDLQFLAELPGTKVVCKGNHDYWWPSDKQLDFEGLHDTPFLTEDKRVGVAGTRGWAELGPDSTVQSRLRDQRMITREVGRLEKRLSLISECDIRIAMIHHPPLPEFAATLLRYGVSTIVYGHVHLGGSDQTLPETWNGMRCLCVAADRIGFSPRLVATLP